MNKNILDALKIALDNETISPEFFYAVENGIHPYYDGNSELTEEQNTERTLIYAFNIKFTIGFEIIDNMMYYVLKQCNLPDKVEYNFKFFTEKFKKVNSEQMIKIFKYFKMAGFLNKVFLNSLKSDAPEVLIKELGI